MSLIFKGIYLGGGGGGSANLTTLDVTPMINYQSISPEEGYDGFSLVNVSAVNSSIDANITAGNILNGVEILGVTGNYVPAVESLDVTPMTSAQSFVPNVGVTGFNMVNVSEVNSSIDPNITASNIVNGVNILGVVGVASATAPKEVARYKIYDNGAATVSEQDITGMFDSIVSAEDSAFSRCFNNTNIVGNAVFNNLTSVENFAFREAFSYTKISEISCPQITSISNSSVFSNVCYACQNLTKVDFSNLQNTSDASYCFQRAFFNTPVETINFQNLTDVRGGGAFSMAFNNCQNLTEANFSNLVRIGNNSTETAIFSGAFTNCQNLTKADFSNLVQIVAPQAFQEAFRGCVNLTQFIIPSTMSFSNNAFTNALTNTGITSFNVTYDSSTGGLFQNCFVDCKNLTNAEFLSSNAHSTGLGEFASAFKNCTNLLTANFCAHNSAPSAAFLNAFMNCSNLYFVNFHSLYFMQANGFNNAFNGCTNLKSFDFTNLGRGYGDAFGNMFRDSGIENITFPSFTSYSSGIKNMLTNVSNCVVHFPSGMESSMNTQPDVLAGFGGTNTTVLFDLPTVYTSFPNITNSGEVGGANFAVATSFDSVNAYKMFDRDLSTGWVSSGDSFPHELTLYSPNGASLSSMNFITNRSLDTTDTAFALNILGSNDGNTWTDIAFNQANGISWGGITMSRDLYITGLRQFYKYHKIIFNTYNNYASPAIVNMINCYGIFKE